MKYIYSKNTYSIFQKILYMYGSKVLLKSLTKCSMSLKYSVNVLLLAIFFLFIFFVLRAI